MSFPVSYSIADGATARPGLGQSSDEFHVHWHVNYLIPRPSLLTYRCHKHTSSYRATQDTYYVHVATKSVVVVRAGQWTVCVCNEQVYTKLRCVYCYDGSCIGWLLQLRFCKAFLLTQKQQAVCTYVVHIEQYICSVRIAWVYIQNKVCQASAEFSAHE